MDERIRNYWTSRARDFADVRREEYFGEIGARWSEELERYFPSGRTLRVLDVGTGSGFFAVMLAFRGHDVIGIDLTPTMIEQAKSLADEIGVSARFEIMDAQNLTFESESFDAVISRNLTWTLPHPEQAYKEWHRVLRSGGILLNYDANYSRQPQNTSLRRMYGHKGVTNEQERENREITMAMPAGRVQRPEWDIGLLSSLGFTDCSYDLSLGKRVLREQDIPETPMFGIYAAKRIAAV